MVTERSSSSSSSSSNRETLFGIYSATHPEIFGETKQLLIKHDKKELCDDWEL